MTLLSPMWLLSLLALPLLAALYLLKVRPQRKPTNAYFLWQQIFEQKTTSALFRRLRDFLSLLLMLLAFALLALALADPQFKSEDERDLIIVIDSSASMQAIENGRSLLDHAKDEAVDMIRALNGSRQAAIASLDTRLNFQTHLSSHPRELLLAIESVAASDRVLSADAMRQLGAVVATEDSPYRVLFLTDSRHGLESYPDGVEVLSLETEKLPNLGFVAADMQWLPGRSGEASFYCRIINSGSTEAEIDFELVHQSSGAIGKFTSFKIPAGGAIEQVYELAGIEAGVWLAQLIVEDALELDNSLYLGLNPRQPLMVGIDAENSWFFQNCVQAFARAGGILRVANQGGDLRLSEGVIATNAPMRVIFRPEGESKFWSGLGEPLASVVPEVLIPEHPVIEHTELDGFSYANARSLTAPPGSVVLVATEQGVPLIYKASADGEQAVVFNFDPAKEDFFLSPWFPVIVHSAALHLAGRESEFSPVYATGETIRVPGPSSTTWTVTGPNEWSKQLIGGQSLHLDSAGVYQLQEGQKTWFLGAGLLSREDSELIASSPTEILALASGSPVAIWLLVLGLLILAAESALYHRRKLG